MSTYYFVHSLLILQLCLQIGVNRDSICLKTAIQKVGELIYRLQTLWQKSNFNKDCQFPLQPFVSKRKEVRILRQNKESVRICLA